MHEPLVYHGLCTVDGCPAPSDPDWHIPWCGHGLEGHHHHWPPLGRGGTQISAFLCPACHDGIHGGVLACRVDSGNFTMVAAGDSSSGFLVRREIATGRDLLTDPEPERQEVVRSDAPRLRGTLSEVGWTAPARMSYPEWEQSLELLGKMRSGSAWGVGDCVLAGERRFGEMYSQALDLTGLTYDALKNIVSLCSRIPIEERVAGLSMRHHEATAKLPPEERRRMLTEAITDGHTSEWLRTQVRALRSQETQPVAAGGQPEKAGNARMTREPYAEEELSGSDSLTGQAMERPSEPLAIANLNEHRRLLVALGAVVQTMWPSVLRELGGQAEAEALAEAIDNCVAQLVSFRATVEKAYRL